jgi:hypothetical protein
VRWPASMEVLWRPPMATVAARARWARSGFRGLCCVQLRPGCPGDHTWFWLACGRPSVRVSRSSLVLGLRGSRTLGRRLQMMVVVGLLRLQGR